MPRRMNVEVIAVVAAIAAINVRAAPYSANYSPSSILLFSSPPLAGEVGCHRAATTSQGCWEGEKADCS
jgi:hypothetical protein